MLQKNEKQTAAKQPRKAQAHSSARFASFCVMIILIVSLTFMALFSHASMPAVTATPAIVTSVAIPVQETPAAGEEEIPTEVAATVPSIVVENPAIGRASAGGWSVSALLLTIGTVVWGIWVALGKNISGQACPVWCRFIAATFGIIGVIGFLLMQNLSAPVVLFNRQTLVSAIIALAQAFNWVLGRELDDADYQFFA